MAQMVKQKTGNKAKGRQHMADQARRKVAYEKRYFRKLARKRKRDAKVFAAKVAGIPHKSSPSDQRRAAARKLGFVSARIRITRERRAVMRAEAATKKADTRKAAAEMKVEVAS